jgi:hypothetical protein
LQKIEESTSKRLDGYGAVCVIVVAAVMAIEPKGRIPVPVKFSDKAGLQSGKMDSLGVFDPVLDLDTRLFIDPHLLAKSKIPEFEQSYGRLHKRFGAIAKLLISSKQQGDVFWRNADQLMVWPEVKGLCIGYTRKGTAGHGMGRGLRSRLLDTASQILKLGVSDPEIFELVGLFEKDIGPDLLSDMTATIIADDLDAYTLRIFKELEFNPASKFKIDKSGGLPINPFSGDSIRLLPKEILRDLPVALDWTARDAIFAHNRAVRDKINETIGNTWKEAAARPKDELRRIVLSRRDLLEDLIASYKAKGPQYYDFAEDKAGQYLWIEASRAFTTDSPLLFSLSNNPSTNEVHALVFAICEKFKKLVEDNGLSKLFYDRSGRPKHEEAMQLLFYGVSECYCEANNVMVARESNGGRGPVDFRFGTNMKNNVLVEIKKSTNTSGLDKGVRKQLPIYMKSDGAKRAIYVVIDVGYSKTAAKTMQKLESRVRGTGMEIFHIDGNRRQSASK